MKYSKTVCFLLVITFTSVAFAQESDTELAKNVFKVSPQHFTANTLKIGLENFTQPNKSISFYLGGRTGNNDRDYYSSNQFDGVLGELQYRKYVKPIEETASRKNRNFQQGIYLSAFLQGGYYSGDFKETEYVYNPGTGNSVSTDYMYSQKVWNSAAGFTIGVQRVYWDVLYIDLYVGGGLQLANDKKTGDIPSTNVNFYYSDFTDPDFQGIIPKIGIQIGLGL